MKKIINFLFVVFLNLASIELSVFCEPLSLQLFTRTDGGITKKIAIVGVRHEHEQLENDFFNASKEIIARVTQSYNQRTAHNPRPIDIIMEAYNSEYYIKQVQDNKPFLDAAQIQFAIPSEMQLAHLLENNIHPPFIFHQADIRDSMFDGLGCATDDIAKNQFAFIKFFEVTKLKPFQHYAQIGYCLAQELELALQTTNPGSFAQTYLFVDNFKKKLPWAFSPEMNRLVVSLITQLQATKPYPPSLLQTLDQSRPCMNALTYFLMHELVEANFLLEILKSQQRNNKTVLFCGNNHLFGIISKVLPLLGYQRYFKHGVFTLANNQNSTTPEGAVSQEIAQNPITIPMYRWMLCDFLTERCFWEPVA